MKSILMKSILINSILKTSILMISILMNSILMTSTLITSSSMTSILSEGCKQEGGLNKCEKINCMYSYTCKEPGCRYKYIGESHNNFRTRAKQHLEKYNSKSKAANEGSFIYKHQAEKHRGNKPNMKMKVEKTFHDNLTRG